jgi:hypothetical protein
MPPHLREREELERLARGRRFDVDIRGRGREIKGQINLLIEALRGSRNRRV